MNTSRVEHYDRGAVRPWDNRKRYEYTASAGDMKVATVVEWLLRRQCD